MRNGLRGLHVSGALHAFGCALLCAVCCVLCAALCCLLVLWGVLVLMLLGRLPACCCVDRLQIPNAALTCGLRIR